MRIIFALLIICLAGCQHDDSNQDFSPLVGKWITDACENNEVTDPDGSPVNTWAKGIYEFQSNSRIIMSFRVYSGSSCSGGFNLVEPSVEEDQYLRFNDLGQEMLEEGIEGGRIKVIIPVNDVPQDASNLVEGFYTINSGALCFSRNINLNAFSSSFSPGGDTGIDFENCLSKLSQP